MYVAVSSTGLILFTVLTAAPSTVRPQAFTTDFRVHWAQHPLRPEFAESTYFLYKVIYQTTALVLCFRFPEGNIYYHASFLWFTPPQAAKKKCFPKTVLNWSSFHSWYTDFSQLVSSHFHQATGDPYYLEAGRTILDNLNRFARVPCGFAAMKDVRTGSHEDR